MFIAALFRIVKNGNNPDAHQTVKGETVSVATTEPSSPAGRNGLQVHMVAWRELKTVMLSGNGQETPDDFTCEILASAN